MTINFEQIEVEYANLVTEFRRLQQAVARVDLLARSRGDADPGLRWTLDEKWVDRTLTPERRLADLTDDLAERDKVIADLEMRLAEIRELA